MHGGLSLIQSYLSQLAATFGGQFKTVCNHFTARRPRHVREETNRPFESTPISQSSVRTSEALVTAVNIDVVVLVRLFDANEIVRVLALQLIANDKLNATDTGVSKREKRREIYSI